MLLSPMAVATERFLRRGVRYLGAIPEHESFRTAAREPTRLLACAASEPIRTALDPIIDTLALAPAVKLVENGPLQEQELGS